MTQDPENKENEIQARDGTRRRLKELENKVAEVIKGTAKGTGNQKPKTKNQQTNQKREEEKAKS